MRKRAFAGGADVLSLTYPGIALAVFAALAASNWTIPQSAPPKQGPAKPGSTNASAKGSEPPVPAGPQAIQRVSAAPGVSPTTPVVPQQAPTPPPAQRVPGTVNNVFTDTDVKQALADIGSQVGVSIVADDTVTGTVTASFKNTPLEQALATLCAPGNYSYVKMDGFYLVGKADPTSPNYLRFASTTVYKPSYEPAEKLATMLPAAEAAYVKYAQGEMNLFILAAPLLRDRILDDLKALDRPPIRIVMQAEITEMSTEVMDQYGFSWLVRNFGLSSDTSGTSFTYTKATQQDLVTLNALLAKNLASIKGSPQIMTVEGKEAMVEVATEDYFTVITGPANFPYASLQTIKTGITLKMTPWVSDKGEVTVQLSPEVSDALQATNTTGLPLVTARRASTTVRVKDGETIVIGGMQYVNNRRITSKVPILGDLPLIGGLFTTKNNDLQKTDVVIMVTPHIIRD